MSWWKRKPKHATPNPRDKKRRLDEFEEAQHHTLATLQFFVFALALIILAVVPQ